MSTLASGKSNDVSATYNKWKEKNKAFQTLGEGGNKRTRSIITPGQ